MTLFQEPDTLDIVRVWGMSQSIVAREVSGTVTVEGMLRRADGTNISFDPQVNTLAIDTSYDAYLFFRRNLQSQPFTKDRINDLQGLGVRFNVSSGSARATQCVGYAICELEAATLKGRGQGGFDLKFKLPALSSLNDYVGVIFDLYLDWTGWDKQILQFKYVSGPTIQLIYGGYDDGSDLPDNTYLVFDTSADATNTHEVRVLLQDLFLSVYIDNEWTFTFWMIGNEEFPVYPEGAVSIWLYANTGYTITDISVTELSDWREAVFVDMETTGGSAIAYIIQQRPVEAYPTIDGGMDFVYDKTRTTVTVPTSLSWQTQESEPGQAGSDIVVYADNVYSIYSTTYMEEWGFALKVYRLPELDHGAKQAAETILQRTLENLYRHSAEGRPDIRVEIGDKARYTDTLTGTGTAFDEIMIVESINFGFQQGQGSATYQGRDGS
jgi:hypothetical protein